MGLFDLLNINNRNIYSTIPIRSKSIIDLSPRKKAKRENTRRIERTLKNIGFEKIGKAVEVVNNIDDSIENIEDACSLSRVSKRKISVNKAKKVLRKGEHIGVYRSVYSHHGVYDGKGFVYEYNEGIIRHTSLEAFAGDTDIYRVEYDAVYNEDEIISRAMSRLCEENYNVIINNCEHFAVWCRLGEKIS